MLEVKRGDGKRRGAHLQRDELHAAEEKAFVVLVLQGVVKVQVPEVGEDVDPHQAQGHQHRAQQQQQGRVLLFGCPERPCQTPEIAECLHEVLVSPVAGDVEFAGEDG
ncbi:hypothetical protein D3C76_1125400 [compost metagenome]